MPSTAPGVTIKPAAHGANVVQGSANYSLSTPTELLKSSCFKEFQKIRNGHIIQSSFAVAQPEETRYMGASNGFVNTAILAYNQHLHLTIRPEDVWFTVLVQLNTYINAHAEELRHMFVAHQGQKPLVLSVDSDTRIHGKLFFGVDWAKFAYHMAQEIEQNIHDPSLREWFMPAFSTTTKSDQTTASIILMSSMQKYFSFTCETDCGLPSVTLLGRKSDWEKMLLRLERLKTFGEEPTVWYGLLKPVFERFARTFEEGESQEMKDFWQRIAQSWNGGSGPTFLSGWITAFCFWDEKGNCFYKAGQNPRSEDTNNHWSDEPAVLSLDGMRYHKIEQEEIPAGWASVPVTINDNGHVTSAAMVAGSVGMQISSSGKQMHSEKRDPLSGLDEGKNVGVDTVQPASGWWMYETFSKEEFLEERRKEYEEKRKLRKYLPEWEGEDSLMWLE